jgi:putative transposase
VSEHVARHAHQAGWHNAKNPVVPGNIAILFLPPYSPELNPVERLWAYRRSHFLGNRVDDDYDHLPTAGAEAWRRLTPERLRSVCRSDYLTRGEQV